MTFRGFTTVLDHKKWVFAYVVMFVLTYLVTGKHIDGSQFMMGLIALIPSVIGASSFDKSAWRVHDGLQNDTN